MTDSFDFYRPPVLSDPSLRLLDRRGIWAFGGFGVLAAILLLGLLLRLDKLGASPRGPMESVIARDWRESPRRLDNLEAREVLPPAYRRALRVWGILGSSTRMFRLHSTLWALILIAVAFRVGIQYLGPPVGALGALLLAISPPFVAAAQTAGPAPAAAVWLLLNLACLLRAGFRRASHWHWTLYALTGALAILCHPLSVWVVLTQAVLAFGAGPREERQRFYGPLAAYALLLAVLALIWFRLTRPLDPALPAAWGLPTEWGPLALLRLLGADVLWGTRVYPTGLLWTLISVVAIIGPLVYGGLAIRNRPSQDLAGFLLIMGVAPVALILLAPRRVILAHCPATDVVALVLAPLALWAAAALRLGLREHARQALGAVIIGGMLLLTPWSSRVQVRPEWAAYRDLLADQAQKGHPAVRDRVAPLADFEEYLASRVKVEPLDRAVALAPPADKTLLTLAAVSPLYEEPDPAWSPDPLIRDWLKKNCPAKDLLAGDFFRLSQWTEFDPAALREFVNRATFYDPTAWDALKLTRWLGPYDPDFEGLGRATRLFRAAASPVPGRLPVYSRTRWIFAPKLPPDSYHVLVPLRLANPKNSGRVSLVWTLPRGGRQRQVVTNDTTDFSFVWDALVPNQRMKLAVTVAPSDGEPAPPPVVFYGVGFRRYFPYVIDIGAPFDTLALGDGWHAPERDGEVTYRWTGETARAFFHLPSFGGINLEGHLSIECARRQTGETAPVEFEVYWDGQRLEGHPTAGEQWDTARLLLPASPPAGRHEVMLKSPAFAIPDPANAKRQLNLGIMVNKLSIE